MRPIKQIADAVLDSAVADLAKIEAAACYVKGVDLLRRQLVFLASRVLWLFIMAFAIVAVPVAVVVCLPLASVQKVAALLALSAVYLTMPAVILWRSFSQEHWMRFSRADHYVEEAVKKN